MWVFLHKIRKPNPTLVTPSALKAQVAYHFENLPRESLEFCAIASGPKAIPVQAFHARKKNHAPKKKPSKYSG